jgi:hypothetical protein
MTHSRGHARRRQRDQFHFDEGDQMPYRWPRGSFVGTRGWEYLTVGICLVLLVGLFALIAYMAHWRWG